MRILIIHQYFLGAQDAGGSRFNQFARYWAEAGHDVTVLAGTVHYATGRKPEAYRGRFLVRETAPGGVRVLRCHVSEQYNVSYLGRAWAYVNFMFSSLWAGLAAVPRPDVIVATSPPLTVAITMWLLAMGHRAPAVFEVRDLMPETAIATGIIRSRLLIWLGYRLEALAYRRAAWVNVLTPAFEEVLVRDKGVPRRRVSMIPNGADLDILKPGPRDNDVRRRLGLEGKFVVGYFGAHGRCHRVGQLLDVAARLKETHPDVRIMLVGDGMEKPGLRRDAAQRGLDNVLFADPVPKNQVGDYINATDVCTAVLMKSETFKTVYPNKVFDYMCCARPIIIGIDGVARRLVEDAGAGLFAEPENPDAFVRALLALKDAPERRREMGESGHRYAAAHYSRKAMAMKYLEVLERLAARRLRAAGRYQMRRPVLRNRR